MWRMKDSLVYALLILFIPAAFLIVAPATIFCLTIKYMRLPETSEIGVILYGFLGVVGILCGVIIVMYLLPFYLDFFLHIPNKRHKGNS